MFLYWDPHIFREKDDVMEDKIIEIKMKATDKYDSTKIYRDTSNNYVRVLNSYESFTDKRPKESYHGIVSLSVLYFDGEIKKERLSIDDFETRLKTGEVKEYFPGNVEKAKLALKGFLS